MKGEVIITQLVLVKEKVSFLSCTVDLKGYLT